MSYTLNRESVPIKKIEITDFNPARDCTDLALLYAEVFAESPWEEYTQCNSCSELFRKPSREGSLCPKSICRGELEYAYPLSATVDYMLGDYNRQDAIFKVVRDGDALTGFIWGYPETIEEFASRKYKTYEMRTKVFELIDSLKIGSKFFYVSDCGVRKDYRGRGLSNQLVDALATKAQKLSLGGVLRTIEPSPMILVARRFGMTQILGPNVDFDARQKTLVTNQKPTDTLDLENRRRLLFGTRQMNTLST